MHPYVIFALKSPSFEERQVLLQLCLIDGAASVLLLNVLCIMEWITVFLIALVQVFLPEPLPH